MKGLLEDLRHAARIYGETPLSSAIAVIALGVAIAGITASFSLLSDLVLKSHSGFAPEARLVTIGQTNGTRFDPLSLNLLERMGQETSSLEGAVGVHEAKLAWVRDGQRQEVNVESVSRGYFPLLRPTLLLGQGFTADEHQTGAAPAVIVSFDFWQHQLGGRSSVLGTTLKLAGGPEGMKVGKDGKPEKAVEGTGDYRIVGVFAPQLLGTFAKDTDLWVPYEQAAPIFVAGGDLYRAHGELKVIGLLRPGASVATALQQLTDQYREGDTTLGLTPGFRLDVLSGVVADIGAQRDARRQVRLLLAGSVLLVLVAASNISLFLFSQAPRRQRELGIRMAVGASTGRLARQLATEAALIVVAAALLGLLISLWLAGVMQNLALLRTAEWHQVSPMDWQVLLMVLCSTLVLTVLVSLAPVLGIKRMGIATTSRTVSARAGFTQRTAETIQIALASVLGGAAIAFVWYLIALNHAERGFNAEGVYVIDLKPPDPRKVFSVTSDEVFTARAHRRMVISGLPGIRAVSFGNSVPGRVIPFTTFARPPNAKAGDNVSLTLVSSDPNYPDVLGMTLLYGRKLAPGELGAALVNETLARQLWGRTNVVGEVLQLPFLKLNLVGVLKDAQYRHPGEAPLPLLFVAFAPISIADSILVRSSVGPQEIRRLLQAKIDQGAIDLDITSISRLDEVWGAMFSSDRARASLTSSSAVLVVILAAFGFYGTQRYLVNAGRREYAIRSAIGAGPRSVRRLVLSRGVMLGLPGLVVGAGLTYTLVAWLRDEFVSRDVSAPAVMAMVAVAIALIMVAATLGPATRAAMMDPAPLLREE